MKIVEQQEIPMNSAVRRFYLSLKFLPSFVLLLQEDYLSEVVNRYTTGLQRVS